VGHLFLLYNGIYSVNADRELDRKPDRQPRIFSENNGIGTQEMSTGKTVMETRRKGMPVVRFEPTTLAGRVFETRAYTVPPHRLDKPNQRYSPCLSYTTKLTKTHAVSTEQTASSL
jgi:hypothetical protein